MSWSLLAPAAAIIVTLATLAWSMHRVEIELGALRAALRRSRAAGVAVTELERATAAAGADLRRIDANARLRADLRRNRRRSGHR